MVSAFELLVGGVVMAHVLFLAAVVYYDSVAVTHFHRLFGTSPASVVVAGTLGSGVAVGLGVAGTFPPWLGLESRRAVLTLALLAAPLVVGFVGLAVAYGNGRTLRRLGRRRDAPVGGGDAGPVALTGVATPLDVPGRSPLFGRDALCWVWHLDARNWGGGGDGRYHTVRAGDGGVTFLLEHETGSVRVDPSAASFELAAERVEGTPAESFPEGADRSAFDHDWSLPGDRWRHHERALEPGATVTVFGTVSERPEGPTVDAGTPFVVASGGSGRFERRCRTRLQVGAFLAVAGVVGGTWLLVQTFAVPF